MFCYSKDSYFFISNFEVENLTVTTWEEILRNEGIVYYLNDKLTKKSRMKYMITDTNMVDIENESLELLRLTDNIEKDIDVNIIHLIQRERLVGLNVSYENWLYWALKKPKKKWKINLLGLGDVGGTLAIGLKLLGSDCISSIGIYDRDLKRLDRWERELNQIKYPFEVDKDIKVNAIGYDDLFDCDMFVFCASRFVPEVGSKVKDVRMVQFESNAEIIKEYAKKARIEKFDGVFAVVSDPVDLLCKSVYLESNKNTEGEFDGLGILPDRVRGYGLGVMNARACYYAEKLEETKKYLTEGRAFGPHGKDLIIADSIIDYDNEKSLLLTEQTINANIEVREAGYKPFIAPALSSGALSLIATIKGEWHYSATFIDEVYMGAKNRFKNEVTELERLDMPKQLYNRIENTYKRLKEII